MQCALCGRDNRADARFCDACGTCLTVQVTDEDDAGSMVGRETELAALAELLGRMMGGHGAIVALAGEPGIGKSHTAQMLARRTSGVRTLWGRCNEEPGAPPYWPWLQIMRVWLGSHDDDALRATLGTVAGLIAELLPEIRQRFADLAPLLPTSDPQQQRFRLFDAMVSFWKLAAAREPLLLIIDNLHWADASSLRLLEFLAPEIGDSRILLLTTYRDIELNRQHPLSVTLGDLARYSHFHRFRLTGLNRRETTALITQAGGNGFMPALLDAIYSQTEGNPLFIGEMTRLLIQEGVLRGRTEERPVEPCSVPSIRIPEGVKEVIGRRLNHLSPQTNRVLERAALIGRTFDLQLLRRVLDEPLTNRFQNTIEEALQSHILEAAEQPGWFQFSHALIRETLYEEIPIPTRGSLHLRVAQAIEDLYGDDADPHLPALAHHYTSALPGADATRAADIARRAAERATRLLAHEEAARYYRLALQATGMVSAGDPASKSRLLNALGESLTFAGEYLQAREAFEQAMSLASAARAIDEMTSAALGFEMATWAPGLPGQAAARLLREALTAQSSSDSIASARLLSSLARALIFSGEDAQAAIVREQAVAMARRSGDTRTLVSTLVSTLSARWQPERSAERLRDIEEALHLAERTGDVLCALDAQAWQLFELMELGDLQTWLVRLEQYEYRAAELQQPFVRYVAATSRATFALLVGRFDDAERLIEQALQIGRRMPGLDAPGVYGMQMFTLRCEQGRLRELAPLVRAFVNAMPKTGIWRPGLALIYAEIGLLDAARGEFEALAVDDFAVVRHDALRAADLAYLAQVCARLDDTKRANVLYAMLLPYDGRNLLIGTTVGCFGASSSLLGLLATTRREWHDAQRHFESALAMNLRQGAEPALARTRLRYASMRLARNADGDADAARVLLEDARAAAERMGMRALTEQIDNVRHSIDHASSPSSPSYPAGLSAREAQVLRLVASGLGNREIAERLFVSPNTVANHIRAILAKTDSANRTEAAAFAIRNGMTA
jgi:DNA-binding CsgD family transcriptional regulator/tetratricopeptide (TPR) repeat protein